MPLVALAGIGIAGAIGGAAISSHAAGKAADTQAAAADRAAQLQYQASQNSLAFEKQQYADQQANLAPWLQSGKAGLSNLNYLLGINPQGAGQAQGSLPPARAVGPGQPPTASQAVQGSAGSYPAAPQTPYRAAVGNAGGIQYPGATGGSSAQPALQAFPGGGTGPVSTGGATGAPDMASLVNPSLGGFGSLMTPYGQHFTAPTDITEQNDPGYQARLALGTDAIQRSAAARGGVLTGGTAKALDTYAQDYASNEYNNVYNRALGTFTNNYNQYNTDQANQYNRLAALAGVGQQTASQLGALGNQASQNVSSNLLGTAANMGQDYQNAAAASASGYVGAGNAWGGAVGNAGSSISNLLLLKQMGAL